MRSDAGYDPRRDFEPIIELVRIHWALVASPKFPVASVQQLIAAARALPGGIDFASGGQGSSQQLAMELFMRAAKITLVHVPYRGATPALNDVLAGQTPVMFTALPTPLTYIAEHRLTVLGTADLQRLAALPQFPTIAEQGFPGFEFLTWAGLLAPAGTPAPIIAKLQQAAAAALGDPAMHQRLTDFGYDVVGGSSAELRAVIAAEYVQKQALLSSAGIHAD